MVNAGVKKTRRANKMHIFCSKCREYLADVEPLEDETVVEGLCVDCRRELIKLAQLTDKPIRRIGFIQDKEDKK